MTKLPQWAIDAKKLKDAATPGKWSSQHQHNGFVVFNYNRMPVCFDADKADAEFIAASPTNQDLYHSALVIALEALHEINFPAIWLDAGSDGVVKCAKEAIAQINGLGEV